MAFRPVDNLHQQPSETARQRGEDREGEEEPAGPADIEGVVGASFIHERAPLPSPGVGRSTSFPAFRTNLAIDA